MENYSKLKNEYYEIIFPSGYEEDIKEILDYSTNKLLDNLNFFNQVSYEQVIRASFFDKKNAASGCVFFF